VLWLEKLLAAGYFPSRLPPPFTSRGYGSAFSDKSKISQFRELFSSFPATRSSRHNQSRPGSLRRKLSIPNPVSYWKLADFVVEHQELIDLASQSPISMTHPKVVSGSGHRAIERSHDFDALPVRRNEIRTNASYILKADVSRFYHSIYTHAIAWALHTKSTAKADRFAQKGSLFGSDLDRLVRNLQDNQTLGIPIGPDISFLIAELVITKVDLLVLDRAGNFLSGALRYIDDYEFAFQKRADAEQLLGILQEALNDYELALNPSKTAILSLPLPCDSLAISELRCFNFRITEQGQKWDLLRFFDRAFCLANEDPEEAVLTYAISKLGGETVAESNWRIYENFLLHCGINEPGSLKAVIHQLIKYGAHGFKVHTSDLGRALNIIILRHAPLGHGSEVAWSLWIAIVFNCGIEEKSANAASYMDDSVVGLLLLDCAQRKLIKGSFDLSHLSSFMTGEELRNEMWLFAYEANVKGWLPNSGGDFVERDPQFALLKQEHISFYDDTAADRFVGERPAEEPTELYF